MTIPENDGSPLFAEDKVEDKLWYRDESRSTQGRTEGFDKFSVGHNFGSSPIDHALNLREVINDSVKRWLQIAIRDGAGTDSYDLHIFNIKEIISAKYVIKSV